MKLATSLFAGAAGCLVLAGSVAAFGQPEDQPPPAVDSRPADRPPALQEQRRERERQLHDALRLRPDQQGAWDAMVEAMRPDRDRRAELRRGPGEASTTPERLDRMSRQLEDRLQAFERRADAIKRFYAILDSGQRQTFDSMAELGGGMGRGMRRERPERGPGQG